ncbi:hypothetical protein [Rhodovulum sp. ES.010]|uniref:hypothetical protein n=1 Tax=Rhodovulum sp. ES.010 TaxID=1882821 RepID=UPI001588080E|nr:hypothetical protein [Rhodovulum sp. ES.010]
MSITGGRRRRWPSKRGRYPEALRDRNRTALEALASEEQENKDGRHEQEVVEHRRSCCSASVPADPASARPSLESGFWFKKTDGWQRLALKFSLFVLRQSLPCDCKSRRAT